jgi:hypothetical protein
LSIETKLRLLERERLFVSKLRQGRKLLLADAHDAEVRATGCQLHLMIRRGIEHHIQVRQFAHDRRQALHRQGDRSAFLHVRLDLAANAEVEVGRGQRNEVLVRLDQHVAQDGHRGLRTHDVEDLGQAVAEVVAVNFEFHGARGAVSKKLTKSK